MGIAKLQTVDKLRIEKVLDDSLVAYFDILNDHEFTSNITSNDIEIVAPVYGNAYFKFKNPVVRKYNSGSFDLGGLQSQFELLENVSTPSGLVGVKLVIGGTNIPKREFIKFVITSLSYVKGIKSSNNRVEGTVNFIEIP